MPHICSAGYLIPPPAGVVQRPLLFVVVVQANCAVVLLFLFEHFGTVQCPTLSSSTAEVKIPYSQLPIIDGRTAQIAGSSVPSEIVLKRNESGPTWADCPEPESGPM